MNLPERLNEAYRIVDAAAAELAVGNDPASGYTVLAYAALNSAARARTAEHAAAWAESYAASVRQGVE